MLKWFCVISFSFFLISCSSTNWVVENQNEIDRNDFKLLESRLFLDQINGINPKNPILRFGLKSENKYEYAQRIKTDRYIQRYRPRFGYTLFGVGAASLATYTALSDRVIEQPSNIQQAGLLGSAVLLTGISFINMKAVGEPTPTGETRLLRKTGSVIEIDTLDAQSFEVDLPVYSIYYDGQTLVPETQREFVDNEVVFNLVEELNPEDFPESEDVAVDFRIIFKDSLYQYKIPVSSVFEQFVVVSSSVTALRNSPDLDNQSVLTDLAFGSQIKMVSKEGDWYKVLYGISENWVSANDVYTIWRPSEFVNELSVITILNVPFGSVDVERDIPEADSISDDKWAFIISNQAYSGKLSEKSYGLRDGRLIEEYLQKSAGLPVSQTLKFNDVSGDQPFRNGFNRLASRIANQPADLFVYLNGYVEVDSDNNSLYFLGTAGTDTITTKTSLNLFFDGLASLPLNSISIILDVGIINPTENQTLLDELAAIITGRVSNSVVVFSSELDQDSYLYSVPNEVQKRHSIFSYYFADAIKNGNRKWRSILDYMERNVSFTSRSLYNRPQDIRFFGNLDLNYSP